MSIVRFRRPTSSSDSTPTPLTRSSRSTSIASDANSSDLLRTWEQVSARVAALIIVYPHLGHGIVTGVTRLLNQLRF